MGRGRYIWQRPVLMDGTLAAFLIAISIPLPVSTHDWWLFPLLLALIVPLVLRRRYPVQVFALICTTALIQWLTIPQIGVYDLAVLVALYSMAAYRDQQWSGPALAIALGGAVLAWATAHALRDVSLLGLLTPGIVIVAVWIVGRNARTRRAYLSELEQRAGRLEREQDALARAAVAEERARIAREMHDVVAHSVAVMVAQAEGASVAVRAAPHDAEHALEVISDAGRAALAELRRTLGVLRENSSQEAADIAPQPGLADLDSLVAAMRAGGLPVSFVREGDNDVSATMALATYRIVQESLTNTLKHAGPRTPTQLLLRRTPQLLEVQVIDRGGGTPAQPGAGCGQGLAGIRERVAMFGGELVTGPTASGGWQVRAVLPIPAGRS